jgi:Mce-associated membrane protein
VSPQRATTVDVTTNDESVESSVDAAEIGPEDSVTVTVDDSRPPNDDEQGAIELPDDRAARTARGRWTTVAVFGLLPALLAALALTAGFFKWQVGSAHDADLARVSSLQAATEGTVSLLTYQAKTVDTDLATARDRLTGPFRDSYTSLIHDVVIPGSKQQNISTVATVPAAASVSASAVHAVALLYVDQTTTVGTAAPTATASSVRVTLDKVGTRWLISGFEPV